jgi:hypothetical protein
LSYRAIFLVSAALVLPLLVAIARVRSADIHFGRSCGQPDHHASTPPPRTERLSLSKNYNLLIFAGCLFLFQFANASMLPVASERLAYRNGTGASFIISALIILPQIVGSPVASAFRTFDCEIPNCRCNSCGCDARPEGSADGIYLAECQRGCSDVHAATLGNLILYW